MRKGFTWSQNLWNPAELTYMTAPVTWFSPDVLSNASLDLAEGRITLGPILLPGQKRTVIPLLFPRFWASLEYAPAQKRVLLHILKTFDTRPIVLKKLIVEPIGTPASQARTFSISPVTVTAGHTIDLSSYLPAFARTEIQDAILESQH